MTESKVSYPVQLPLDGRTWWAVCGGDADERVVCARTRRSAIAALKRQWIEGDRANGASLAWAMQTVAVAEWSAQGPFTTPQAYRRVRRKMLWEATEDLITRAVRPDQVDDYQVMAAALGERKLARLEAGIVRYFTDPEKTIV